MSKLETRPRIGPSRKAAVVVELMSAPDVRQVAAMEFLEEQPDESAPEPEEDTPPDDPAALFEVEAEDATSAFDGAAATVSAVLGTLPRSLRLPVEFRIDGQFRVIEMRPGGRMACLTRRTLANGVAKHLAAKKITLEKAGEWVHIPAIGSDQALIELAGGDENIARLMKSYGSFYKSFALLLPNGDVVALPALINGAAKDRTATRAGVLRKLAGEKLWGEGSMRIAGEDWSFADLRERRRRSLDNRSGQSVATEGSKNSEE